MGRLDGRIAIVTGGARGIGRAIGGAFAAEGATVVTVDRDREAGASSARDISARTDVLAAGGSVAFLEGDVSDEARAAEIAGMVRRTHGRIDVLVNNAAIQREARLHEQTVEDFHAVVNVNLLGTFLFTRAVIPSMLAQGRGVIVNLSSVLGLVGDALLPVYAATKAGILGLTRSTAVAYAAAGIRANAICPGDIDTELNQQYFNSQPDPAAFRARIEREYPQRRIGTVDEIARVAVFLASDDASFVNGTHVTADGGILARLFDLYD